MVSPCFTSPFDLSRGDRPRRERRSARDDHHSKLPALVRRTPRGAVEAVVGRRRPNAVGASEGARVVGVDADVAEAREGVVGVGHGPRGPEEGDGLFRDVGEGPGQQTGASTVNFEV